MCLLLVFKTFSTCIIKAKFVQCTRTEPKQARQGIDHRASLVHREQHINFKENFNIIAWPLHQSHQLACLTSWDGRLHQMKVSHAKVEVHNTRSYVSHAFSLGRFTRTEHRRTLAASQERPAGNVTTFTKSCTSTSTSMPGLCMSDLLGWSSTSNESCMLGVWAGPFAPLL
jgi:hypothetical protein